MRKFLCCTMAIFLLMTFSGLPAYGYGGSDGGSSDGGSDSDGSTGTSMTDFGGSSGNTSPEGFTPIDMEFVSPAPPSDLTSVGETPVTGGPRELSEEELQILSAAFEFIMVTSGGIIIGYATAGAGWTVLGQAAASGAWSGTTTYILIDDDNAGEQSAAAALQDFAVGFTPFPPPVQSALSYGLTQVKERLPNTFNHEGASLSDLRRAYRGF